MNQNQPDNATAPRSVDQQQACSASVRHFRIQWRDWLFEWDADYGCNHRRGWSVALRGSYFIQLVPFCLMLKLLWIAKRTYLKRSFGDDYM
jgi:hypothetical protein